MPSMPAQPTATQLRRRFFVEFFRQVHIIWPILSGIFLVMTGCGMVIGRLENWGVGESLYFTFVTGLTIGYGDLTPKTLAARLLAMVIGFSGIVVTGLVAAVSVQALKASDQVAKMARTPMLAFQQRKQDWAVQMEVDGRSGFGRCPQVGNPSPAS